MTPDLDPRSILMRLPPILFAITVHELAHAWTAVRCGDPTPKDEGRVTLNPLAHLDPIGALLLFFYGFGWGKPVMVSPSMFRHPRRDDILVSAAGVATNLATALLLALVMRSTIGLAVWESRPGAILWNMCRALGSVSLGLMVFNLIPIPPLDGSHVLRNLLPCEAARAFDRATPFLKGLFVILFFGPMFGLPNVLGYAIGEPVDHLVSFVLGPANAFRPI